MSGAEDPAGASIVAPAMDTLVQKATLPWPQLAMLAAAAGVLIAFGSTGYLVAVAGGAAPLMAGVAFSVGLLMVMMTGAELFTGNTLFVLPAARGRLSSARLAGAWGIAWLGNLAGSLIVVGLVTAAGGLDEAVGRAAAETAADKFAKGPLALLTSGVVANMLVCLAVWMAMGARTVAGKALAVVGPVAIFVGGGFEHSIANMALLPMGLIAGAQGSVAEVLLNLILSTLGNIAGGGAVALTFGYGHGED